VARVKVGSDVSTLGVTLHCGNVAVRPDKIRGIPAQTGTNDLGPPRKNLQLQAPRGTEAPKVVLNPLCPPWYNIPLAIALYSLRRLAEASRALNRLPRPDTWTLARLAACYAQLERSAEAKAAVTEILRQRPDFSTADYLRKSVLLEREQDRELLREGLLKAELPE
jgi:hypothetical protein